MGFADCYSNLDFVLFSPIGCGFHSTACQALAKIFALTHPNLKAAGEAHSDQTTIAITKKFVNLPVVPTSDEGRQVFWDDQLKGFGLRVYPSGDIVFVLQFRIKAPRAQTQTITIGKYGSPWTPDAARTHARDLLEKVRKGIDPADEARVGRIMRDAQAIAALQAAEHEAYYDFNTFADRYIERHVFANNLRNHKGIEGTFERDLRTFFEGKSILEVTRQDCKDLRFSTDRRRPRRRSCGGRHRDNRRVRVRNRRWHRPVMVRPDRHSGRPARRLV